VLAFYFLFNIDLQVKIFFCKHCCNNYFDLGAPRFGAWLGFALQSPDEKSGGFPLQSLAHHASRSDASFDIIFFWQ
jgi:hypothetical protein